MDTDYSLGRSLEEELLRDHRRERWAGWAKRYGISGGLALGAAVLVAVIGYVVWDGVQTSQRESDTSLLLRAIEDEGAQSEDQLDSPGLDTLARLLRSAGTRSESELLWNLADDQQVRPYYRDLAFLLALGRDLASIELEVVQIRLQALQADDSPWRFTARELQALLLARTDDREQAIEMLRQLETDQDAPSGIKERAGKLVVYYEHGFPLSEIQESSKEPPADAALSEEESREDSSSYEEADPSHVSPSKADSLPKGNDRSNTTEAKGSPGSEITESPETPPSLIDETESH